MDFNVLLFLLIGLIIGFGLAYVLTKKLDKSKELQTQLNTLHEENTALLIEQKTALSRADETQKYYNQLKIDFQALEKTKDELSNELSALRVHKSNLEEKL